MTSTPDLPESLFSAMTAAVLPLAPPLPWAVSCALTSSPQVLPGYVGGFGTRQPVKPKTYLFAESQNAGEMPQPTVGTFCWLKYVPA